MKPVSYEMVLIRAAPPPAGNKMAATVFGLFKMQPLQTEIALFAN
jgi:hypothetical protein